MRLYTFHFISKENQEKIRYSTVKACVRIMPIYRKMIIMSHNNTLQSYSYMSRQYITLLETRLYISFFMSVFLIVSQFILRLRDLLVSQDHARSSPTNAHGKYLYIFF